jgi:two-component SAPR family response regulator
MRSADGLVVSWPLATALDDLEGADRVDDRVVGLYRSPTADTRAGSFDRALAVAQMALQADPDAEQIELCLLRLYRRMGAGAAAAEQYTHYAGVMREQLGVEPPPLESI